MSADNSSLALQGNPVLYSFIGFTIQPYWLIIIELGLIQFLQRLYSRFAPCRTKEEKTWFIPLELAVIGAEEVSK